MSQFDEYFSMGLKPPTCIWIYTYIYIYLVYTRYVFLCAVVFEFNKGLYIWRLLWVNSEEPQHFTPLNGVVLCDISCLLSPNMCFFALQFGEDLQLSFVRLVQALG